MLTAPRRRQLTSRITDIGGVDAFHLALLAIPADPYLMGRTAHAFRLDLDHLLRTGGAAGDVLARLLDAAREAPRKAAGVAATPVPLAHDERTGALHARLRARYGDEVYGSWFNALRVEHVAGGTVRASLPTKFLQTWVQSHYADALLQCCKAEFAGATRLVVELREAPPSPPAEPGPVPAEPDQPSPTVH